MLFPLLLRLTEMPICLFRPETEYRKTRTFSGNSQAERSDSQYSELYSVLMNSIDMNHYI